MAKSNTSSMDDPIRLSYQRKGTFKTAKNIVSHRGFVGLYSGFRLHLREAHSSSKLYQSLMGVGSERYDWYDHLLYDLRKHETTTRQISKQQ